MSGRRVITGLARIMGNNHLSERSFLGSRPAYILVIALFVLILEFVCAAQNSSKAEPQPSLASLQRQLDELKQSQQLILKEMDEIKKALHEKSARTDALVRPQIPPVVSVNIHGEPFRGANNATIGMIEYSDFDCSFCAKYAKEIYPKIEHEYIETGKIKYFFRDLPAPGDTNALLKARLARCAGEQGKFWEMHDFLFTTPSMVLEQNVEPQAQALGLDAQKLNECFSSDRYEQNIQRSASSAAHWGIVGTPAFLLGTLSNDSDFLRATNVLVGAESYTSLKSILDNLLGASTKP